MPSPIVKGNKIAKGGARPGAGRKSKQQLTYLELEQAAFIASAIKEGQKKGEHYSKRVYQNDAVLLDYRKWVTDRNEQKPQGQPIAIQIVVESSGASTQGEGSDRTIDIGGD